MPSAAAGRAVWPHAGASQPVTASAATAATAPSLAKRVARIGVLLSSGSFLDLVDVVGDKAVSLPVDAGGGLGCGGLDQAEHLAVALIDPVPEVPDVVSVLGLEIGKMCLGDVVHRHAAGDLVNVHEKRHLRPALLSVVEADNCDRRRGRTARSSGKLPGLRRAIA